MKKIPCVGVAMNFGCDKKFTSWDIASSMVMTARMTDGSRQPVCGECMQKIKDLRAQKKA